METTLTNQITSASGNDTIEMNQLSAMIRRWFTEDNSDNGHLWDTDKHVVNWMETQLGSLLIITEISIRTMFSPIDPQEKSTSQESIKLIRKEAILRSMKNIPAELLEDVGKNQLIFFNATINF